MFVICNGIALAPIKFSTLSLAYNYNCINFIDTIHLYFAPTSGAGQLTLQRECGRMQARESGSSRKPYYSNVRRLTSFCLGTKVPRHSAGIVRRRLGWCMQYAHALTYVSRVNLHVYIRMCLLFLDINFAPEFSSLHYGVYPKAAFLYRYCEYKYECQRLCKTTK